MYIINSRVVLVLFSNFLRYPPKIYTVIVYREIGVFGTHALHYTFCNFAVLYKFIVHGFPKVHAITEALVRVGVICSFFIVNGIISCCLSLSAIHQFCDRASGGISTDM